LHNLQGLHPFQRATRQIIAHLFNYFMLTINGRRLVQRRLTKVGIAGVVGQELGGQGWKIIHSAPDESGPSGAIVQISDEGVREAVKAGLLDMAELLTVEAGYAATFKDQVNSALLHHVRVKFLKGSSLGLAERADVDFAWRMLRQVKAKVAVIPGLIAGVIEHGD